ncbi:polyunsaturated fatty acid 5-lipoxygenase-like [Lytechinus variegatus]|uniref:polyunsaturated fatty acid 5-lipoxygenase-like n=1 Tax=Lytechinus variegatus TaxID=7654 RepID=UPI001BB28B71|nr:polyunsaturated fatty acid 5-lipoxygenase-like [Lytechinus variegatus]
MGVVISKTFGVPFSISVKTGDRKGAGTDSNVVIALYDTDGRRSNDLHLDSLFRDDFESGGRDRFHKLSGVVDFGTLSHVELWRDSKGLFDDWFCDVIDVVNMKTKERHVFPVHRWIPANKKIKLRPFDMILPQKDEMSNRREEELKAKKELYKLTHNMAIPQVKSFPKDESFSNDYLWDLGKNMIQLTLKAKMTQVLTGKWKSLEDIKKIYKPPLLPLPEKYYNWRTDMNFGYQRLTGCNPGMIRLCTEIPKRFAVTNEALQPLLENMTIDEALVYKRLFIIDYEFLRDLPCSYGRTMCAPTALFYLNDAKCLLPVAIQLFPDPAPNNPVFYPTDPEYTWLLAKMYFNNADGAYHESASHLGFTHVVGEAIVVATHQCLSPSHPVFRLLAPHFLYLIAINNRAVGQLISPGGHVDKTMVIGRVGMLEIIKRTWCNWRLDVQGSLIGDLQDRGVLDPEVLPNYHYRDDALLVRKAINDYCRAIISHYYDSAEQVVADHELQEWGRIIGGKGKDPDEVTVNMKGLPNGGKFMSVDDVVETVTNFMYICSVAHASVNFGQYDEYAYPPNYPAFLHGKPPKDKTPLTEKDIIAQLPDKEETLDVIVLTKILSSKGTNSLGDFEVQYIYDPPGLKALDKFRKDLEEVGRIIDERNETREVKYTYLHPKVIPNSISI